MPLERLDYWKSAAAERGVSLSAFVRDSVEETIALEEALRRQQQARDRALGKKRDAALLMSGLDQ